MLKHKIIDAFPRFRVFWNTTQQKSLDEQINDWASEYMAPWPELLTKQQDSYASEGEDWRHIAKERVFPFLAGRLPEIERAYTNLQGLCEQACVEAQKALGFESEVIFVIYVGIGCGAGWVTQYENTPAILLGLENIAECGWSDAATLKGLIAHEMGHMVHFQWRTEKELPTGDGPWWQLYTEGFAQRCEHLITGQESWHMGVEAGWLHWCQEHRDWLAEEFLRTVDQEEPVRRFFGSWYQIEGKSQTGYFLGCELIKRLEKKMSLKEIALLSDWRESIKEEIEEIL
ncbi:MAG: hypothetical protein JXA33_24415 [Anaerolineae bacterium]|nr:hypothetical protein [Anaerolineae bacterium]